MDTFFFGKPTLVICGTQALRRWSLYNVARAVWVHLLGHMLGASACLAVFAGTMRDGMATLHPDTKPYMFMFYKEHRERAACTLSGFIRSKKGVKF
jgi:hypothetical protein